MISINNVTSQYWMHLCIKIRPLIEKSGRKERCTKTLKNSSNI